LDPANPRRFLPTPATSIPVLLQTYDTIRRFRSQKVRFTSREMGRILSGNEPGLSLEPAELRDRLFDRLRWIYDYDQQQQVDDAFLLFEQTSVCGGAIVSVASRLNDDHYLGLAIPKAISSP
jgi:salicylate hydroxylase